MPNPSKRQRTGDVNPKEIPQALWALAEHVVGQAAAPSFSACLWPRLPMRPGRSVCVCVSLARSRSPCLPVGARAAEHRVCIDRRRPREGRLPRHRMPGGSPAGGRRADAPEGGAGDAPAPRRPSGPQQRARHPWACACAPRPCGEGLLCMISAKHPGAHAFSVCSTARVLHVGPYADGLDEGRARRARHQVPCPVQAC